MMREDLPYNGEYEVAPYNPNAEQYNRFGNGPWNNEQTATLSVPETFQPITLWNVKATKEIIARLKEQKKALQEELKKATTPYQKRKLREKIYWKNEDIKAERADFKKTYGISINKIAI